MTPKANLFGCNTYPGTKAMLLTGLIAGSILVSPVCAQSSAPAVKPATTASTPIHYRMSTREAAYYGLFWGVDSLTVKSVESGELIRFSYHVLDADKAKSLNDKKIEPSLVFPAGRISLVIPALEKVGQLRQTSTAEAGKSYWMAFSNPGRRVKRGDKVNVVIGQFQAEGLVVE